MDYDIDGLNLIYSSAEIFTWAHHGSKRVLILYGGEEETHEFALPVSIASPNTKVTGVKYDRTAQAHIIHWRVRAERTVLSFGEELDVYLLWRNDAYQYWSLDLPAPAPLGLYPSPSRHTNNATAGSVIIKAGYLLRKADISGQTLHLSGDINSTTDVEIISTPVKIASLTFNNHSLNITENSAGNPMAVLEFQKPDIRLPDLSSLQWAYHDSLPEIQSDYDDSAWKSCNLTTSNNPRNLTTPTSLYASDYGYHAGSFIYRGHFIANGGETTFSLTSQGASAYGHSVWINGTFLGSFVGEAEATNHTQIFGLELAAGQNYVFTVLIDHMGLDLNFWANTQPMKNPRGILDYSISGRPKDAVQWKMTGNPEENNTGTNLEVLSTRVLCLRSVKDCTYLGLRPTVQDGNHGLHFKVCRLLGLGSSVPSLPLLSRMVMIFRLTSSWAVATRPTTRVILECRYT